MECKRLAAIAAFFMSAAHAQPYLDAGISYSDNRDYKVDIQNPVGHLELGYEYKRISVFARHSSSLSTGDDVGINQLGAEIRLWGKR